MPVGIEFELEYCPICIQMTNHARLIYNYPERKETLSCLKCRVREGKPRITTFNKDMAEEERNYYGEAFDETR